MGHRRRPEAAARRAACDVRRAVARCARASAKRHHTRPGGVAPAAFAPPAHRKKALATGASGSRNPPKKKRKDTEGDGARCLPPLPGASLPLCRLGSPSQTPAPVAAGSGTRLVPPLPASPTASLLVLRPTVCCRGTREGPSVACVPTGLGRLSPIRRRVTLIESVPSETF